MADKVIITNLSALKEKYRASGVMAIKKAIRSLIAADKKRGLNTTLVALDDAKQMEKLNAPAVKAPADAKQNKRAIDGVYQASRPDYLMLLGATDVIPHQDLRNPLNDGDALADGDLPYACDAPYSQSPQSFIGPSRVVGRLPDLTGADDPAYLLSLLKTAAAWQEATPDDYANYFGLTAKVWEESTRQSLNFIFGNAKSMKTSPKSGPQWKPAELNTRLHFINAHGADSAPTFYGQLGADYPECHEASIVGMEGNITEGTVVVAECCYGGQLYPPLDGQMSICYAYLAGKAYGFLGSTTIAYGPAADNGQADLICKFFLREVLNGASLGRAALEARQRFVKESEMSPSDLKTLAQFNLYGDPSITPVRVPSSKVAFGANVVAKGGATGLRSLSPAAMKAAQAEGSIGVKERRLRSQYEGQMLLQTQPVAGEPKPRVSKAADKVFDKILQEYDELQPMEKVSYEVQTPPAAKSGARRGLVSFGAKTPAQRGAKAAAQSETTAFHVLICKPKSAPDATKAKTVKSATRRGAKAAHETAEATPATESGPLDLRLFEAKEVAGKIVSVREIHSR